MNGDASAIAPLLRAIQHSVPIAPAPFARIGADLGRSEAEVLAQLRELVEQGILREISAVLEGSLLGYESALVAGIVPEDDLERVVAAINAHPTITHNYLRDHRYNLWFTLAVPLEPGIERTLRALERSAGVHGLQPLRRTATFKIGVNFDPESLTNRTSAVPLLELAPIAPSASDVRSFRTLQTPLPLEPRPFAHLAAGAGLDEAGLVAFGRRHLGAAIRRYIGTLRHRRLGVMANGMVVWRVPEAELDQLGQLLAEASEVSHCYARNPIDGFPYTLYSMLHGPDEASCRKQAAQLARRLGVDDYLVLFSLREYKKERLRYFLPELDAWWAEHGE